MVIKIEMEGDGFSFDRRIPMGIAVQIVQLIEEEEFEIEQAESDEKTEPSADEEVESESGDEDADGDVQGWR